RSSPWKEGDWHDRIRSVRPVRAPDHRRDRRDRGGPRARLPRRHPPADRALVAAAALVLPRKVVQRGYRADATGLRPTRAAALLAHRRDPHGAACGRSRPVRRVTASRAVALRTRRKRADGLRLRRRPVRPRYTDQPRPPPAWRGWGAELPV